MLLTFDVNGEGVSLAVDPDRTLVEALREDLDLTGTKASCEMGDCGSCTVLLDGQAVYSCLVLAAECEGRAVETIEGMADGQALDPLQSAFVSCDALQCGYCTPGQIMSLEGLRRRVAEPTVQDVEQAVTGNLCRCGAYRHILDAACQGLGIEGARS
jgi:aerobic-type carbon monoxide dehydrogenase small subunit (CoxS/CutS family)